MKIIGKCDDGSLLAVITQAEFDKMESMLGNIEKARIAIGQLVEAIPPDVVVTKTEPSKKQPEKTPPKQAPKQTAKPAKPPARTMQDEKQCVSCHKTFPIAEMKGSSKSYCAPCLKEYQRQYREKHKAKTKKPTVASADTSKPAATDPAQPFDAKSQLDKFKRRYGTDRVLEPAAKPITECPPNPRNKTCATCQRKFYDASANMSQEYCGGAKCGRDMTDRASPFRVDDARVPMARAMQ